MRTSLHVCLLVVVCSDLLMHATTSSCKLPDSTVAAMRSKKAAMRVLEAGMLDRL